MDENPTFEQVLAYRQSVARMTDAEICQAKGFRVGDLIVGNEGYGDTVIQITAIGRDGILAVKLSHCDKHEVVDRESHWTLSCRDWRHVDPNRRPKPAATDTRNSEGSVVRGDSQGQREKGE